MTKQTSLIEQYEATPEGRLDLAAARASIKVLALLNKAFDRSGLTQEELSEKLGVTAGRVSQVLNGDGNYTVATIAKFLAVMGEELVVNLDNPLPEPAASAQRNRHIGRVGMR